MAFFSVAFCPDGILFGIHQFHQPSLLTFLQRFKRSAVSVVVSRWMTSALMMLSVIWCDAAIIIKQLTQSDMDRRYCIIWWLSVRCIHVQPLPHTRLPTPSPRRPHCTQWASISLQCCPLSYYQPGARTTGDWTHHVVLVVPSSEPTWQCNRQTDRRTGDFIHTDTHTDTVCEIRGVRRGQTHQKYEGPMQSCNM